MGSWRDQILNAFVPKVSKLTLVADPDILLLEEGILEGIRNRGFELIPYEDPIAFRYAYESNYRSKWDIGGQTDLVVVLRCQNSVLDALPYDLLQTGNRLAFGLADIFPRLNYPIVSTLDRSDLDRLYEATVAYTPDQLGENDTKSFILRHVFGISPELINQPEDLLRVLLRRHYRKQLIPDILDKRFIQLLRNNNKFIEWPLDLLVTNETYFYKFLQERWPIFLDQLVSKAFPEISENKEVYELTTSGPKKLPFDHGDVRIFIDNLFTEGLLHPVPHVNAVTLTETWVRIGIQSDPIKDRSLRVEKIINTLKDILPSDTAKHTDWLHFARLWAELIFLTEEKPEEKTAETNEKILSLQSMVDKVFTAWLLKRYSGLCNLPPEPPAMLHHLPRFLSRQLNNDHDSKIALLVLDGLSIDQWLVIKEVLNKSAGHYRFEENAVFAWVPSLTAVSRQSIFSGNAPMYFPLSIERTDKEPLLWEKFWSDEGLTRNEIMYEKGLGDGDLKTVFEGLSSSSVKVAGLVVNKIDDIMHGMALGTAGMHNQIGQWAKLPYLNNLLKFLLDNKFMVYLTADHGNIEATGCGIPKEGSMADYRGERVRVFSDESLRKSTKDKFPNSLEWAPIGLPEKYLPLLASERYAFIQEKQKAVCHGGISIEELIVPFIKVTWNKNQ